MKQRGDQGAVAVSSLEGTIGGVRREEKESRNCGESGSQLQEREY